MGGGYSDSGTNLERAKSHFVEPSIHIETQCKQILHGYPGSDRPDVRLTWITDLNEHGVGGVACGM